jgi:hypothetical protein
VQDGSAQPRPPLCDLQNVAFIMKRRVQSRIPLMADGVLAGCLEPGCGICNIRSYASPLR